MADVRFPNEGSIPELLAALASPEDIHGAVAAAAVAAAMGASLLQRVAELPQTRSHGGIDQDALPDAAALVRTREELLEAVETETAVKLFAARNLPQASKVERAEREGAIQFALRAAADVPLEVMRLCSGGLRLAELVASRTPRAAATEVELAVALLEAAFNAARSNVDGKLTSLTGAVEVTSIGDQVARLSQEAATAADTARSRVKVPPA